jgi:hypothetical protein
VYGQREDEDEGQEGEEENADANEEDGGWRTLLLLLPLHPAVACCAAAPPGRHRIHLPTAAPCSSAPASVAPPLQMTRRRARRPSESGSRSRRRSSGSAPACAPPPRPSARAGRRVWTGGWPGSVLAVHAGWLAAAQGPCSTLCAPTPLPPLACATPHMRLPCHPPQVPALVFAIEEFERHIIRISSGACGGGSRVCLTQDCASAAAMTLLLCLALPRLPLHLSFTQLLLAPTTALQARRTPAARG